MFENTRARDVLVVRTAGLTGMPYNLVKVTRLTKTSVFVEGWGDGETRWVRRTRRLYGGEGSAWGTQARLSDEPGEIVKGERCKKERRIRSMCTSLLDCIRTIPDERMDHVLERLTETVRIMVSEPEKEDLK